MIVRRRGRLVLAVLGALALAAACRDADAPEVQRLSGTYALRSINGSLPYTVGGGFGFQTQIFGGRLRMVDGSTVEDVFYVRNVSTSGAQLDQQVDSSVYAYRTSNDTLFIERPAPFAPDSWRDTARLYGNDSITVRRRLARINGFRPPDRAFVAYAKQ